MTTHDNPASQDAKLLSAHDDFIAQRLPTWIKQATPAQINRLRDRFSAHQASQTQLRASTIDLIPLQAFAEDHFETLLAGRLPTGTSLDGLEWLEVTPRLERVPGALWPIYGANYRRQQGLLRLMQNFHEGASFYDGSGLVQAGGFTVLSGATDSLVSAVRALDAGQQYQVLLSQVFSTDTCMQLQTDKRAGFLLALEVAAIKGDITPSEQAALQALTTPSPAPSEHPLGASARTVSLLGCVLADALAIDLTDADGQARGVVLYLPSDAQRAFRRFESWAAMGDALVALLRQPAQRQLFAQRVSLESRAQMLATLNLRLKDPTPDLQLTARALAGDAFAELVRQQVAQVKADAQLLLVPTARADRLAAKQRLEEWKSMGLDLLNLAGLFIPVVGALLLGQLVVQTLSEVYEGAVDWYHGHQHEALQHMLGVAETVAVTAAVATGASLVARGFSRSAFVDGLEPVTLESGQTRLWSSDMDSYSHPPEGARMGADGLHALEDRRWIRVQGNFYEVHQPEPDGPWRVRHPWREDAFEPIVEFNGERGWRIRNDRPLEWQSSERMFDSLWPLHLPTDPQRAEGVLKVAGMDVDELRGVLVEGRVAPVNLRETLRRFDAEARIEGFFASLAEGAPTFDDPQIEAWCLAQPGIAGLDEPTLRSTLSERAPALRGPLLTFLTEAATSNDPLILLLRRDFPGLPVAYAEEAVKGVGEVERRLALREARIPLSLATRARSLLQSARLSRALAGLYLQSAYSDETGELVMALLGRVPNWPSQVNFEVLADNGRRIAVRDLQGPPEQRISLVRRDGRFRLYDHEGRAREEEVAEPCGIFQAIVAVLTPEQLTSVGIAVGSPAEALRRQLLALLPATARQTLNLLGWRVQPEWFNPGQRMADGRVGYPLSGRGAGRELPGQVLRNRIRALYPGLSDAELEVYTTTLLNRPGSPFDLLLRQELCYRQLDSRLRAWTEVQTQSATRSLHREFSNQLRRCWRMQGERAVGAWGEPTGMRLDLSGLQIGVLPELPEDVEFGHVTIMVLCNMQLTDVPVRFLRAFDGLRQLTLNSNRLSALPRGIAYLVELRVLRMAHNDIRLDPAGTSILSSLAQLRHLDLSYNPLNQLELRFNYLHRLVELRLRHCRLRVWPRGLELCAHLEYADLSNNQIASIPESVLGMPLSHRMGYVVRNNPLSAEDITRLTVMREHASVHASMEEQVLEMEPVAPAEARALWVDALDEDSRPASGERWDNLLAMPNSGGLFLTLGALRDTADFEHAHAELLGRVWALLAALDGNAALRERIYARANEPLTCEDSVAQRFSDLQVEVLVAQADAQAPLHERGAHLLTLGRQLFRLERLEQFARQDMAQRVAENRGVDEIEVSLYYRVHLAQALDLPLQPRTMHYETVANVSDAQLQEATQVVQAAEASDALAENLVQRDFWRAYLRERHSAAFDAIDETFAERGSQLDDEQATLTSAEYRERWDILSTERETALHALLSHLTREALLGDFPIV